MTMKPGRPRRGLPRGAEKRTATAYHEAGHAIMTICLGGIVSVAQMDPPGCGCYFNEGPEWLRAFVLNSLAGWRAEQLWHGRVAKDDIQFTDDCDVIYAVKEAYPDANYAEIKQRLTDFSTECYAILRKPEVWAAVERVAEKLLERGKLDAAGIAEAVGSNAVVRLRSSARRIANAAYGRFFALRIA
jgi:hypothetical protein